MRVLQANKLLFILALGGIYWLNFFIQANVFYGWDISATLHEARVLWSGGILGKDFFEQCPPLFLYLYMPVLFLVHIGFSNMLAVRLYFVLLTSLSLILCYPLIQKIYSNEKDQTPSTLFFLTIAVLFLILPLPQDFGQREHCLIVLSMPYFLLVACRLENKTVNPFYAAFIGVMAGIGFLTKPFFLITPFLIELFYICKKRNIYLWQRIEIKMMLMMLVIYLLVLFLFFKNYFTLIIPIAKHFYYQGYRFPWVYLFREPLVVYSSFALVFFLISKNTCQTIHSILVLALISFLFVYFLQQTIWYYHLYPAFSIAILLFVLLFSSFTKENQNYLAYLNLAMIGFLVYCLFYYYFPMVSTIILFSKAAFFCFVALLYGGLLYTAQVEKNSKKIMISLLVLITIAWMFSFFLERDTWYPYLFSATVILVILLYGLVAVRHTSFFHNVFIAMISLLLFGFPVYHLYLNYLSALDYKIKMSKLIDCMHALALHQGVYFLSTRVGYEFPAIDYAGAHHVSRFTCLLWLPALVKHSVVSSEKNFFINMTAEEVQHKKPLLLLIDMQKHKPYLGNIPFDYLNFFSDNPKWIAVLKNYRYLKTIEENSYYKFAIYRRYDD